MISFARFSVLGGVVHAQKTKIARDMDSLNSVGHARVCPSFGAVGDVSRKSLFFRVLGKFRWFSGLSGHSNILTANEMCRGRQCVIS